jgi:SPX domain protein involved in polyphosphate accumulation
MRYERKYVLNNNMSWLFKEMLFKKNFKKIFFKRKVKSLYFDTFDYQFFRENIEGVENRIKPRIRWYEGLNEKLEKKNIQNTCLVY